MNMQPDSEFEIEGKKIGEVHPTYFIADIAANHDGNLERAIELIHLAARAGADAAKFQHFKAESIVSDHGFRSLGTQQSHQAKWKKSVFEVYQDASVDLGWTPRLKEACAQAGITFFTSPYALDLVDAIDPYVPAYKIGSGDITWLEIIDHIASKGKPTILASGASTLEDVDRAISTLLAKNRRIALLQCNTNYTASLENFRYIQLNVLRAYSKRYPGMVLGLSDHTPGLATVLGAVSLGARIIEKHFTDDTQRVGPDHAFSMDPASWREMVDRTRELENSLGGETKKIEDNEKQTAVLQRRSIRTARDILAGEVVSREDLTMLRPCPTDGLPPYEVGRVVGKRAKQSIKSGDVVRWSDLA
jgi:sialic acid synthase SpsE